MPNYCKNDLTVKGDKSQLRMFLDLGIDFNTAIPYPKQFADADAISEQWEKDHPENPWKDRPKDGFNQGGYEWRVATWGVKWNVSLEDNKPTKVTEKCVKYSFSTAWNPPLPVVVAWSLKYPGLTFELRYYEGGMGFQGRYVVVNGEELVKDESSYSGSRGG